MKDTITSLGGRAPPVRNMRKPFAESRWRGGAPGSPAPAPSAAPAPVRSGPAGAPHPAAAVESSHATSRPNSRSSVRLTGSPPTPIRTRAHAPGSAELPFPAPPPSTALLLPWLQSLKGWSLRQTRGDSMSVQDTAGENNDGLIVQVVNPAVNVPSLTAASFLRGALTEPDTYAGVRQVIALYLV